MNPTLAIDYKKGEQVIATLGHSNIYHPQTFIGRVKKIYLGMCDIADAKGNIFRIQNTNINRVLRMHKVIK